MTDETIEVGLGHSLAALIPSEHYDVAVDGWITLCKVDSPAVVRAWFIGKNPQLDDKAPIVALSHGQVREFQAAVRSFAGGG